MYLLINSPSTAVRNGNESTIPYEDVNINCAEVNATGLQYGGIYKFISAFFENPIFTVFFADFFGKSLDDFPINVLFYQHGR